MPTLYVENVPADLYDALRHRAKSEGRSIAAAVIQLLGEHVPTKSELAKRKRVFELARTIRQTQHGAAPLENTEEMLRADRER